VVPFLERIHLLAGRAPGFAVGLGRSPAEMGMEQVSLGCYMAETALKRRLVWAVRKGPTSTGVVVGRTDSWAEPAVEGLVARSHVASSSRVWSPAAATPRLAETAEILGIASGERDSPKPGLF
jgi:hypothetical protein